MYTWPTTRLSLSESIRCSLSPEKHILQMWLYGISHAFSIFISQYIGLTADTRYWQTAFRWHSSTPNCEDAMVTVGRATGRNSAISKHTTLLLCRDFLTSFTWWGLIPGAAILQLFILWKGRWTFSGHFLDVGSRLMINSYANLIIRVIKPVISRHALTVEPKVSSERAYNDQLHTALEKTVLTNACRSVSYLSLV